jgi:hypothetical protein
MRVGRGMVLLCTIGCAVPAAPALAVAQTATGWGLPQLMQSLSLVRSSSARFTERETMRILNAPLMTSGTLHYVAPDWIQKTTTSPVPERFVLDHGEVTIVGGADNQTHVFSLSDYPQIGGLVDGILATLAGDLPALDRFYAVQLTGNPAAWQLLLQPKGADVARFIAWIRIGGEGSRIDAIDTRSSNGDHSEMSIVEDGGDAG